MTRALTSETRMGHNWSSEKEGHFQPEAGRWLLEVVAHELSYTLGILSQRPGAHPPRRGQSGAGRPPASAWAIRGRAPTRLGMGRLHSVRTTCSSDWPLPFMGKDASHHHIHRPVCLLFSSFPGHIPQLQACSQPKLVYFHKMFLKFTSLFTTGN